MCESEEVTMDKVCGNCIHFAVCEPHTTANESFPEVDGCPVFKDKSRYIELPCAVGDTVYCIDIIRHKTIIKPKVVDFVFTLPFLAESKGEILREKDFGKTVFLTKEEAEKALLRKEDEGK